MQVLENLLGNALKFTSSGGKVMVLLSSKKEDVDFVQVSVADTAQASPKNTLPRF